MSLLATALWALTSTGTLAFDVDYASFAARESVDYVEVYYDVPYAQLVYAGHADTVESRYTVYWRLTGAGPGDTLSDTITKHAVIPSFAAAARRDIRFVDQFGFAARPGTYRFLMEVSSGDRRGRLEDSLVVRPLDARPALSDIELASEIRSDTAEGAFTRNGQRIVPNPGRRFGASYGVLNFYYEIYGLSPDSAPYTVRYVIRDSAGSAVKDFPPLYRRAAAADIPEAGAVSARGLRPGRYWLEVAVTDSTTGARAESRKAFFIGLPETAPAVTLAQLTENERRYYDQFEVIATETERRTYQRLTPEGRADFLRRFWTAHDLGQFAARMKYADEQYGHANSPGHTTDRGRFFVKYGPPDLVESKPMGEGSKPFETWTYYGTGYRFVFVDVLGTGNYRFIYSNNDVERSDPNWQRYLDVETIQELSE